MRRRWRQFRIRFAKARAAYRGLQDYDEARLLVHVETPGIHRTYLGLIALDDKPLVRLPVSVAQELLASGAVTRWEP